LNAKNNTEHPLHKSPDPAIFLTSPSIPLKDYLYHDNTCERYKMTSR